jgi:hypothetical protein
MLNTYIYYHLPPICFGVCYSIFRETIALPAHNLYMQWSPNAMLLIGTDDLSLPVFRGP